MRPLDETGDVGLFQGEAALMLRDREAPAGQAVIARWDYSATEVASSWRGLEEDPALDFALILPDVTSAEAAGAAQRMRTLIGASPIDTEIGPLAVTASVGVSYTAVTRADAESALFATADAALYESKNGGRDRVTVQPLD